MDDLADHELIQMLIQTAYRDDFEGDIFNHPCSIAIRRINSLKVENGHLQRCEYLLESSRGNQAELERQLSLFRFSNKPTLVSKT